MPAARGRLHPSDHDLTQEGDEVQPIGEPITIVSIRREPLSTMLDHPAYGTRECVLEGPSNPPLIHRRQ